MQKKRVVLSFPPHLIDQAVTYRLIKDFDLMINILRARITPKEQGRLVMEITGKKQALDAGINYLKEVGVEIQPLAQDVKWHEDRCVHCTACVSICPTKALDWTENAWRYRLRGTSALPVNSAFPCVPTRRWKSSSDRRISCRAFIIGF